MKLEEILEELERVLMNTYKSDGCVTSAITEIHKDQAISQILIWAREQLPEKKENIGCNLYEEAVENSIYTFGYNKAVYEIKEIFK